MKLRNFAAGVLGAVAFASFTNVAIADGEEAASPWSATFAVTSDYRFRGISQTDRSVATQASIDYAGPHGFAAGVWVSNIDFLDDATYNSSIEVDLYASYTHAFTENMEGSVRAVYYWYPDAEAPPGSPDYNYFEIIGGLSHSFGRFSLSGEVAWTPDYFAKTGTGVAATAGAEYQIAESAGFFDGGFTLSGHFGKQWIENNAAALLPDFTYYDIGISASASIFTIDVRWHNTNLDDSQCYGGLDWCDGGLAVTGSVALGG